MNSTSIIACDKCDNSPCGHDALGFAAAATFFAIFIALMAASKSRRTSSGS